MTKKQDNRPDTLDHIKDPLKPGGVTEAGIRRHVLDAEDVEKMVPFLKGKPRLMRFLYRFLSIDKVNWIHAHNADTPGPPFTTGLLKDLNATVTVKGEDVLNNLPEGAFITVSNHPYGGLDGIMLIHLIGERRPDFKVMVNMFLTHIHALEDTFIGVDAHASDDPAKKAVSMRGIATALKHVKTGHPLGFFPAGAVSKLSWRLRLEDREWQPTVLRLIAKLNVPVIPIFFHGGNSWWFTFLGMIDWRLRSLRHPAEIFKRNKEYRVSVGTPISPEQLAAFDTPEELGKYLREQTYKLRKW